jgi:hypothetical protein
MTTISNPKSVSGDGWVRTGDTPRPDDLTKVMVRNRYDEEFGPILFGMLSLAALDGVEHHASCDIIAYRIVKP